VFTNRRRLVYQQRDPLTLGRSARLLVKISLKRIELISEPSPTPTAVIVPALVGMTEKEALATLQEIGLQFEFNLDGAFSINQQCPCGKAHMFSHLRRVAARTRMVEFITEPLKLKK
jgi:hypothetical protein